MSDQAPSLNDIRDAREALGDLVAETPTWHWVHDELAERLGADAEIHLKLELFQRTGTFKPRGAITNMRALDSHALQRGVTAVSAGNHAIAVAYAARALGSHAKLVMPHNANPFRQQEVRRYGAELVLVDDVHQAFAEVDRIQREEGRTFIHPFEGRNTALGTATVGWELAHQAPELDAVVIPIGGGGLCAGVACAVKQAWPRCVVYGVEPEGADTMHRSFAAGEPQAIDRVRTIADSLGAPHAAPYSFGLCRQFVDELVYIDDDQIRRAMSLLFRGMKLAVEPAGAAATAALVEPLAERLAGWRVGVIVCGTNIDLTSFSRETQAGAAND